MVRLRGERKKGLIHTMRQANQPRRSMVRVKPVGKLADDHWGHSPVRAEENMVRTVLGCRECLEGKRRAKLEKLVQDEAAIWATGELSGVCCSLREYYGNHQRHANSRSEWLGRRFGTTAGHLVKYGT